MSISTREFWHDVIAASHSDAQLERKSNHLIGYAVEFGLEDSAFHFEFHRGKVLMMPGAPVSGLGGRIHGPMAEWRRIP